ncbi:hypothetical protein ACTFIU_001848 [Dictyostelium citrinum]
MTNIIYGNGTFTYKYKADAPYFSRFIFYQNETHPRTEQAPNRFDCHVEGIFRYCVFYSEDPISRLWGSGFSKGCARNGTSPEEVCTFNIESSGGAPQLNDVKFDRYPPTSGGEVNLNGSYIRMLGGPNYLLNGFDTDNSFVVKGNFSDPSFDCTKITFIVPQGSGKFELIFDEVGWFMYQFRFASPIISKIIIDPSKRVILINGDNFYKVKSFVNVYFDGVEQKNFNITVNHTQIQVNNFERVDPGPMSIKIIVNEVSIDNNYIYCFPATITSITSVSNRLGGIVTIKGSKLSSTSNSSLIPTITIGGDKQCKFIKSTTTELECQLDPNESGGKNLSVDVNFGGCNSTSSGDVTFTYNIPTISSSSYSNGIVTLIGTNLGTNNESIIQLSGNGINDNIMIEQFEVSSNEKSATFKLPSLRCKSFNINFTRDGIGANLLSISAPLSIKVVNRPSVSNGTLNIELFYVDCPISSSLTPSITVGNSSAKECSIPSLQSPTSDSFETTCTIPYGTGINKQFTFKYNSESVINEFSYAPPNIESRSLSENQINITINGNNFGNSTSLIHVYFNGNDISSEIQSLNDNQFTFKRLNSYENGPINITVDGNDMESSFYLTLPPIIYGIINKDNKTLSCGGIITVSGKNLLTNDQEFKVKVLANNQNTTIIVPDEKTLIVRAESKENPLIVSIFIGKDLIVSNVTLTYLEPMITVIPSVKNKKDGISIKIGGISLSDIIKASLTPLSSENIPLKCNLQCSLSPNETFYYENPKLSSNETDITNSSDCLLCHSNSIVDETSGILNLQIGSKLLQYDVQIDEIESSLSPSTSSNGGESNSKSSKLSGGAIAGITIGCVAAVSALVGCIVYFKVITRAKNSFK